MNPTTQALLAAGVRRLRERITATNPATITNSDVDRLVAAGVAG